MTTLELAKFTMRYANIRVPGGSREEACQELTDEKIRALAIRGMNTMLGENMDSPLATIIAHLLKNFDVLEKLLTDREACESIIDDYMYHLTEKSSGKVFPNTSTFVSSLIDSGDKELIKVGKEMLKNANN